MAEKSETQPETRVIKIGGECVKVNADDSVEEALRKILTGKGWDVYCIKINGKEILDVKKMPTTFAQCQTVEISRQVTAG